MRAWWQEIKRSCLHLCFPAHCLHCQDSLPPGHPLFCSPCASLLELINPRDRCSNCFNLKEGSSYRCSHCACYPSLFLRTASAFDYQGPAATLVKQLKYADQPYLAKGMAAFLLAQLDQLEWPIPDALIPVPLSLPHRIQRGYNQSALLAEELGRLIQVPVWHALKRTSGGYSQAALSLQQRRGLGNAFRLKGSYPVQDKKLLVIDDVITSGATLHRCAEALSEGYPGVLYALTVCRTMEAG